MKALLTMVAVALIVVGCGERPIYMDADAGTAIVGDAGERGVDAEEDAGQDRGDANPDGSDDAGSPGSDGGADAAPPVDAGADAGVRTDSGAAADAGEEASVDGGVDAGTSTEDAGVSPVGAAVDVTGSRCALDTAGNFWCWGRWTPVEDVRLLGTGFDAAAGSCALRGREVWCAEFSALTMVQVMGDSSVLEVDSISEYSDLARGCGLVAAPEGWTDAVCWTDGGSVDVTEDVGLVAVSATEPRAVLAVGGSYEALDVNPPADPSRGCYSNGTRVTCEFSSGYSPSRPAGDHFVLGFKLACANTAGSTTCSTAGLSEPDTWTVATTGFRDHAVTWPVGTYRTVGGVPWYWEARGLCVGGDAGIQCYDDSGTLAYTVNW